MAERRSYRCLDGRDFPVDWRNPEDAAFTWEWDPEHNPSPVTVMDQAVWTESAAGAGMARAEIGFDPTDTFIGGTGTRYVHGFGFHRAVLPPRAVRVVARETNRRLLAEYGSAAALWARWCIPRASASFDELRTGMPGAAVSRLIDRFAFGFEQTFLMFGIIDRGLQALLGPTFGAGAEAMSLELGRGRPNATVEADQALWDLAAAAAAIPGVVALLDAGATLDDLSRVEPAQPFVAGVAAYLDLYGWRTVGWDPSAPTVRERPAVLLRVVGRLAAAGGPGPEARRGTVAAAREEALQGVASRLAAHGGDLDALRRGAAAAEEYVGIKEGRAHWQLSLTGALRHALQARGDALVRLAALEDRDDVFHLVPSEVDEAVAGERDPGAVRGIAARRRAEWERWRGVIPPARIGGERATVAEPRGDGLVVGLPASPGVFTGVARVLRSFDEIDRFAPGDVLVCATTTPAWTVLMSIAGAVVADGGDLYAHTAVAAREYGIPAVVGARGATASIPDGAQVVVDGDRGVVRLVSVPGGGS